MMNFALEKVLITGKLDDMKTRVKIIIVALIAVMALFIGCGIYLADFYRADNASIDAFSVEEAIVTEKLDKAKTAFIPETAEVGFIFYPGGKVDDRSYEPLMEALAAQNILCVLIEMPFNLAVLDVDAAEGVQGYFPEIEKWYIGGHSLGGSMAASYLADNIDAYSGLVMLASYSTADLSNTALDVLSIYGSNDGVLNREKYAMYRDMLPEGFTELVIEGGNHAGFGMYGEQEDDGEAKLCNAEQIVLAAGLIAGFIK